MRGSVLSLGPSPTAYVTATGWNANGQYRRWSDGFMEQWGAVAVDLTAGSGAVTVPFPQAVTDGGSQAIMVFPVNGPTNWPSITLGSYGRDTSGFSLAWYNSASSTVSETVGWHASGY